MQIHMNEHLLGPKYASFTNERSFDVKLAHLDIQLNMTQLCFGIKAIAITYIEGSGVISDNRFLYLWPRARLWLRHPFW